MAVYNLAMFKNVMGSYWSTTPGQFKMLIVDSIFVCQQASGGDVSTVHFSVQAFMKCAHKGTYWCVEMCEPLFFHMSHWWPLCIDRLEMVSVCFLLTEFTRAMD